MKKMIWYDQNGWYICPNCLGCNLIARHQEKCEQCDTEFDWTKPEEHYINYP